jgi:nicotinate-nucleotide adenylyltransferase
VRPERARDRADHVAPGRIDWVEMPEIAISSTMIRERIAAGLPIGHLVPQGVEGALAEEGLVPSPRLTALRKEPSRNRSS